jgi:hypothetical protein
VFEVSSTFQPVMSTVVVLVFVTSQPVGGIRGTAAARMDLRNHDARRIGGGDAAGG